MVQMHDMTAPEMTRVAVRVPRTTLAQINVWVDTLGVRRSHFLGIALVAGVRSLIHASALEVSFGSRRHLQADVGLADESAPDGVVSDTPDDPDSLAQMVWVLRSEVARLHSEIADLKVQLQRSRRPGRKHGKGRASSTSSEGYTLEKGESDGQGEGQGQDQGQDQEDQGQDQENQEDQKVTVRTTTSLSKKQVPIAKGKDRHRSSRKIERTVIEKPVK